MLLTKGADGVTGRYSSFAKSSVLISYISIILRKDWSVLLPAASSVDAF